MSPDQFPSLLVDVQGDGDVTVTVTGELDFTTTPGLTRRLLHVAACRPARLVLELGAVTFIDVSGARAIALVHDALRGTCPVILRNLRPSARRALTLTGVIPADPGPHQREQALPPGALIPAELPARAP
jgi:anti-sigma B factor antagonist